MSKYEFVCLIDPRIWSDEIETLKTSVNSMLEKNGKILDTDDMWLKDTIYEIKWVNRAYYYSLYLDLDPAAISSLKKDFWITKGVLRFSFFKMKPSEKFVKFDEVNKTLEELLPKYEVDKGQFNEISTNFFK